VTEKRKITLENVHIENSGVRMASSPKILLGNVDREESEVTVTADRGVLLETKRQLIQNLLHARSIHEVRTIKSDLEKVIDRLSEPNAISGAIATLPLLVVGSKGWSTPHDEELFRRYSHTLLRLGWIERKESESGSSYSITEAGKRAMDEFKGLFDDKSE